MLDLAVIFSNLGIVNGDITAHNQYAFFKNIEWSDGSFTNNQYEFYKKIGGRYNFFKQYGSEYEFYKNISDPRIYNYVTFYKYAGEYLETGPQIPIVDFSVDLTVPVIGETITFTDLSTNSPTSWLWDFGDGTTSTLQNPTHIYNSDLKFDVKLTATNSGGSGELTKTDFINVGIAPVADFTVDNLSPEPNDMITFTNTSIGTDLSYEWDFGDGTTSTLENPTHTYTVEGSFDISLKVTNLWGEDTELKVGYINVEGIVPVSSFTADNLSPGTSDVVTFTNTSTDGDTYLWNFGDGNTSTLENPTHTYTIEGTFDVSLEVTNIYGSDTETKVGYIEVSDIIPFTMKIDLSKSGGTVNGFEIPFTNYQTSFPLEIDWGDGNTDTITSWDQAETEHIYSTSGIYDISIKGVINNRSFEFGNTPYRTKLIEIGGILDITNGTGMFNGCSNLSQCNIISLDNLTIGSQMFYNNSLTSWTIPLPNLEDGNSMFDLNSLTSWDTELPKLMYGQYMFSSNSLTSWDTELPNLENGTRMFYDNGLTSWTVGLPNLTNGFIMFAGITINTTDYSNLLIDLDTNNPNNNVQFDGGNSKYNSSAVSARSNLVSRGWTITDGGLE